MLRNSNHQNEYVTVLNNMALESILCLLSQNIPVFGIKIGRDFIAARNSEPYKTVADKHHRVPPPKVLARDGSEAVVAKAFTTRHRAKNNAKLILTPKVWEISLKEATGADSVTYSPLPNEPLSFYGKLEEFC